MLLMQAQNEMSSINYKILSLVTSLLCCIYFYFICLLQRAAYTRSKQEDQNRDNITMASKYCTLYVE